MPRRPPIARSRPFDENRDARVQSKPPNSRHPTPTKPSAARQPNDQRQGPRKRPPARSPTGGNFQRQSVFLASPHFQKCPTCNHCRTIRRLSQAHASHNPRTHHVPRDGHPKSALAICWSSSWSSSCTAALCGGPPVQLPDQLYAGKLFIGRPLTAARPRTGCGTHAFQHFNRRALVRAPTLLVFSPDHLNRELWRNAIHTAY